MVVGITAIPRKVEAVGGVGDSVIEVGPSLYQQISNTLSAIGTSFSTYSLQFKEYVLDGLASMLVKQIIRTMTADVVNWINSGFEGSPSFMTNPGSFFLDMADQITGDFLNKYGGPLTALCSPFSIDIRLALAFKYHPNIQKRYTCTLGAIIKNSKSAVEGATLNGFTAGDFKQGGWPAFVSMTTEPQNNIYGAYLEADSELSIRVANAQIQQKNELNQGKGFLSWKDPKCAAGVKAHNTAIAKDYADLENTTGENYAETVERMQASATRTNLEDLENATGADYSRVSARIGGDVTQSVMKDKNDCPVQTPGSVIVSALEANVNGPLHELQLADELNEIVNALFAQLVTQILKAGLGAVSGSSASDSTSYIYDIQQEAKNDTTNLSNIRNEFIKSVEKYITDTLQYKNNKDQSLNVMLDVKKSFDNVKACYDNKIKNSIPPLNTYDINRAQGKIVEIDSVLNISVNPQSSKLLIQAQEADKRYSILTSMKTTALTAKTVNDMNSPSQELGRMIQNQSLVNANDIVASQQELADVQATATTLKADASRKSQECDIFPNDSGGFR